MEINKQTLVEFRRDFAQAVKNLEDKYNMTVELKKSRMKITALEAH